MDPVPITEQTVYAFFTEKLPEQTNEMINEICELIKDKP